MIGTSIKPVIKTKIKVETRIEARIANIVTASIKTQALTIIKEEISIMKDEGLIDYDKDLVRCPNCGYLLDADSFLCSACGYNFIENKEGDENSINDEIERDEDTPVHADDEYNLYDEELRDYDISDRFSDKLIEYGWNESDAEFGGLVCAEIWEKHKPKNLDSFAGCLSNINNRYAQQLNDEKLKEFIFEEFKKITKEEMDSDNKVPEECVIEILCDKDKWVVNVNNPLAGLAATNPNKLINIGGSKGNFSIKLDRYLNILKEREDNLKKLGFVLVDERKDFFEAETLDCAEDNLKHKPLHQKDVALRVGVSESTLSRWCKREFVLTPHGIFPLKDFFAIASGKQKESSITKKKIKQIIDEINAKGKSEMSEMLDQLKKNGIEMSERNLRYYLKENSDLID